MPDLIATLPSANQLDTYQATVASQVAYDSGSSPPTVRGLLPADYFHAGLVEELGETWGEDRVNSGYNRLGALVGITYRDVLDQNLAKVTRRIKDGTVFNKSGGDTR